MKAVPWLKDDSQVCREKRRLSLELLHGQELPSDLALVSLYDLFV